MTNLVRFSILSLALVLVPSLSFAQITAVGNGSISIPVPCAQGGTGLTSGTTNNVLAFTGSCTIAGTATPTLTGTNFTGIPNSALTTSPQTRTCTTWTPADASGASLTLTVTSANYCKTGPAGGPFLYWIQMDITYPVNASGATAILTMPTTGAAFVQGLQAYTSSAALSLACIVGSNSNACIPETISSTAAVSNTQLSGAMLRFMGTIQAPS